MEQNLHIHSHNTAGIWIMIFLIALLLIYSLAAVKRIPISSYKNKKRISCLATGIFLLGIAFLLDDLAHHHFSLHMVQHLLIGMFAPIALVMAAPVSLLLRSIPTRVAKQLIRLLHSRLFYGLSHPFTALALNMGGMYLLYLTPLYVLSLNNVAIHYLVHWHFLMAGYLFTWSLIGIDPAPRRPSYKLRMFFLFCSIAAHALLAKLMYGYLLPKGAGYSAAEIQQAAQLMYYAGDLAELIIAIILFNRIYAQNFPKRLVALG